MAQTPDENGVPRLPELLPNWLHIWGFPWPHLRFNNGLEWFTRLRKALYLWSHLYFKKYSVRAATWKRYIDKVWEKGHCAFMLSPGMSYPQPVNGFTNPEILLASLFECFQVKFPLNTHNGLNHWPLVAAFNLSSQGEEKMDLNSPNPLILSLVPLGTSLYPEAIWGSTESHHHNKDSGMVLRRSLWIRKETPVPWEITKILRTLCQELEKRTSIYF